VFLKDPTMLVRNLVVALALLPVSMVLTSALATVPAAAASASVDQPEAEDPNDDVESWQARVAGTGALGLRVRSGPGMDFPATATLPDGSRVDVVGGPAVDREGRDWYRVVGRARPGISGWAAGSFLVEVDASQLEAPQVAAARAGPPAAPSSAPSGRTLTARVTAYAHGTRTASGTPVRWGVVSVDPKVIPLGSHIMIEGFDNVFVAEDTGGGVRGNHVDIYFPDVASALRFGVQTRTITVLN